MTATPENQIQVYASLPLTVASDININVNPSNWRWVHCLTLPVETLETLHLSHRPYKWIRYAIAIVVGAEGHLSTSSTSSNTVDYNAGLLCGCFNLFYHTSNQEKRRMFPAGPDLERTSVTSSTHTARRLHFHDEVAERDGRRCVLSGLDQQLCDAVHLLAHSKGDTYISTYTQRRSRDPTGDDIIHDIDNIRNGLLLNGFTHRVLGKDVAFFMTPNFAMNTTDIDPAAPPGEKRYTAHLFQPNASSLLGRETLPSGSRLRMSDSEWPPAILFDAVYASAVLHHFGTRTLQDALTKTWKDTYVVGVTTAPDADLKVITDARAATMKSTQHAQERQARYEARHCPDSFDMLMTLPYILIAPNELQAMLRESEEKAKVAKAAEQQQMQGKVETWRKSIPS